MDRKTPGPCADFAAKDKQNLPHLDLRGAALVPHPPKQFCSHNGRLWVPSFWDKGAESGAQFSVRTLTRLEIRFNYSTVQYKDLYILQILNFEETNSQWVPSFWLTEARELLDVSRLEIKVSHLNTSR